MARSYEEASAARRARVSIDARIAAATLEQTDRLVVQVMERRQLHGLTQNQLARNTGIDQSDLSRVERGSIYPNDTTLRRLVAALGAEWRMADEQST